MSKALVIGDIMLDVAVECEVSRVSPEAPVLVGKEFSRTSTLGGAANVAANLVSLGVDDVRLGGVIGHDTAGDQIEKWCDKFGIKLLREYRTGQRTTVKSRYTSNGQLIFRHDAERYWHASAPPSVLSRSDIDVLDYDVIVFADYNKGMVGDYDVGSLIAKANVAGVPVVVDCKPCNLPAFAGATIITPNEAELTEMCSLHLPSSTALPADKVSRLAADYDIRWVVCTRGSAGLDIYPLEKGRFGDDVEAELPLRLLPKQRRRVYDVTGAGDVITAAIAAQLAGARAEEAREPITPDMEMFEFANTAAGLAVEQPGTTVVSRDAVVSALARDRLASKIVSAEEVAAPAFSPACVVFTNGCFDLLHPGHVHLLREAKREGDILIAAVNSDESVRALKGAERPVLPLHLRMAALASVAAVDWVVSFDEETPEALVRKIKPDVLVKGKLTDESPHQNDPVPGADFMAARGARIVFIDTIPGYSTTAVLAAGGIS